MKSFMAHSALRVARNDAKLVGIRLKKANSGKEGGKPAAGAAAATDAAAADE